MDRCRNSSGAAIRRFFDGYIDAIPVWRELEGRNNVAPARRESRRLGLSVACDFRSSWGRCRETLISHIPIESALGASIGGVERELRITADRRERELFLRKLEDGSAERENDRGDECGK